MKLGLLVVALLASQGSSGLSDVAAKYGLTADIRRTEFTVEARGYAVSGKAVTDQALAKYTPLWTKEWQIYPNTLMSKAKVTKVVFCEGLKLGDQIRAAVPAFDLNTMYYDVALGNYSPHFQRSVVHHEFFHMLDQRMGKMRSDPEWAALNPKDFKYSTGGHLMRTNGVGNLTSEIPGFLTAYGTSAIEEDKAELFAHLIVSTKFVAERAGKDPSLAAKIALLKKRLEAFHAGFNSAFWPKP